MPKAASFEITDEHIRAYEEDGVVCLRGAIEPAWIETIRSGVEKDLAEPGPYVESYTKEGDPGYFFNDFYIGVMCRSSNVSRSRGPAPSSRASSSRRAG